jgi:hypothetical protein
MKCDKCKAQMWNLNETNPKGCQKCDCDVHGTVEGKLNCEQNTGQCSCLSQRTGRQCEKCIKGKSLIVSVSYWIDLDVTQHHRKLYSHFSTTQSKCFDGKLPTKVDHCITLDFGTTEKNISVDNCHRRSQDLQRGGRFVKNSRFSRST